MAAVPPFVSWRTALAGTTATVLASLGLGDQPTRANGDPDVTPDGRYVVFSGVAQTTGVANSNFAQVFRRDLVTGVTDAVSRSSTTGLWGNQASTNPRVSADGRYVAFTSRATDLGAFPEENGSVDAYVRDMATGDIELVSVTLAGLGGSADSINNLVISSDGRHVAFMSRGNGIVSDDSNFEFDVFVRDTFANVTDRASVGTGVWGSGNFALGVTGMSDDGRYVALLGSGLVTGDTTFDTYDAYVRDRVLGVTRLVSRRADGIQVSGYNFPGDITRDGRYVSWTTWTNGAVPGDVDGFGDVFVTDLTTGAVVIVSQTETGANIGMDHVSVASFSPEGQFLSLRATFARNINGVIVPINEAVVKDLVTGAVEYPERVPGTGAGPNDHSSLGRLSSYARKLVVKSSATNFGPVVSSADAPFVYVHQLERPFVTRPAAELFGHRFAGGYASDPVNTATGNFTTTETDLDFPATVFGLAWTRTYNSLDERQSTLGRGWIPAAASALSVKPSGDVLYTDWDGRVVTFGKTATGYTSPEELFGALTKNGDGSFKIAYFDGTQERFSSSGRLTARQSWDGQEVTYAYDAAGKLATVTSSTGRSLAIAWNGAGTRIAAVTADDGRVAAYGYDGDGDLASVTSTDGGTTTYDTGAGSRVVGITDADGVEVIGNTYDAVGRVASQVTPSGDTVTFSYNLDLGVTTVTHGSGASAVYAHDTAGRLISITDAHGKVLTKSYNASGNLTSVVDRQGGTTTQTFDAHGNVTARSGPEGVSESFTFDAQDRLTSHANGEAETTTFTYDADERIPSTVTDGEGATTAYEVVAGLVESTTDADGVVLDFSWNAARNLTGTTDEAIKTTTFTYDAAGNRASVTTPLGHVTAWDHDGRRRVVESTDAEGATRLWTWSPAGRVLTATDAEGHDTDHAYDDAGRIESLTDALGKVTTYAYDLDGNLTAVTRPGGSTAAATYDALGRRLSETDPTGVTATYTYDGNGNIDEATDENGKSIDYDWDLRGRLDKVTDRLGNITDYTWDGADRLAAVLDPLAGTTGYAYDDAGRLISRTMPDGGIWQRSWTAAGRLDAETDPNGHTTDYAYDSLGRLGTATDPLGGITTSGWDDEGRMTSVTSPEGLVTSYGWNDVGRLVSTTSPAGGTTAQSWTATGRLASQTPPDSGTSAFGYDALGRLLTSTDGNGNGTTWTYDDRGNPLTRTDAKGGVESYSWDLADRLLSRTDPLNRTTTHAYDGLGRQASTSDPSGRSLTVSYDDAWRVTAQSYGTGSTVSYGWDDLGRRTSMTDATGTTSWARDAVGRITGIAYPTGKTLAMAWDDAGNRASLTYPDGTTATFGYDAADRLTAVSHPAAGTVGYSYDDDGRLLAESLPGSVSRSYAWDDGRLDAYTEARPEGTRMTDLAHDLANRVTSEVTGADVTAYDYDPAGQLDAVTRNQATTTYGYDTVGNRTTRTRGTTQTVYAYDAAQQPTTATRKVAGVPVETVSFAHDGAGRLTSIAGTAGSRALTYDLRGVPSSVTSTLAGRGTTSTARVTDGDGMLVGTTTTAPAGTRTSGFTWDTTEAIPQIATTSTGGADVNQLSGMGRALALRGGQSDAYAYDAHGSALAIGEAADLARATAYDEWGLPRSGVPRVLLEEAMGLTADGGDTAPRFGYRGEVHLDGLVHLRAREHSPGLGRFTTVDPLEGVAGEATVANPYPYAANDPVNLVDPLGLRPMTDADLAWDPNVGFESYLESMRRASEYWGPPTPAPGRNGGHQAGCGGSPLVGKCVDLVAYDDHGLLKSGWDAIWDATTGYDAADHYKYIYKTARAAGVDPRLVMAVINLESNTGGHLPGTHFWDTALGFIGDAGVRETSIGIGQMQKATFEGVQAAHAEVGGSSWMSLAWDQHLAIRATTYRLLDIQRLLLADSRSAQLSVTTQLAYIAAAYNGGDRVIGYALERGEVFNQNYIDQFAGYLRKADKLYCQTGQFRCSAAS